MEHTPLGRNTEFPDRYDPGLLAPVSRAAPRLSMGVVDLPFVGEDVWTGYELSWLTARGIPRVGALRLRVPADSPKLIESKSLKLYLNGFAQTAFDSADQVAHVINEDLSRVAGAPVSAEVLRLDELDSAAGTLPGECLDACLDGSGFPVRVYDRDPALLSLEEAAGEKEEALYTHLFRCLCPVTGQPDWASIFVRYRGPAVSREGLLRYLISYRRHSAFHETTVEQIFVDLKERCRCERLLVGGYFLRRGGLDINPFRGDSGEACPVMRLVRQ